jgi:hypothetical protein
LIFGFREYIIGTAKDETEGFISMNLMALIKAAFKAKNFFLLIGIIAALVILQGLQIAGMFLLPAAAVGLAGYIYSVVRTLRSGTFMEELKQAEKLNDLERLSDECDAIYRQINRKMDKNLRNKAIEIIKKKDELKKHFQENREDPLKQMIIEQAFKLVAAYLNLMYHYSVRSSEVSSSKVNDLVARINTNNRKLGSLQSYEAVLELTKTVEMDEKLLEQLKEEREELELVSVKLDQMESTIGSFKHQIVSADSDDPVSERIQDVINEAKALDNVLTRRNREKLGL